MIYNVIPINYFGGAGGQFLSLFLYAARENKFVNWIFSDSGNSRSSDKDWYTPPPNFYTDFTGMMNPNHLVDYAKTIPEDIIVYPHGHYADPDLLMTHVNKQIKIYFEPEQLYEIVGMFLLKNPKHAFNDLTDTEQLARYKNHNVIKWAPVAAKKFARLVNSCPDLEPRMLNVSWNDMMYNDPEILISKLHQFTEIPEENFNRDKFAEWRMLTYKTINRLKQAGLI